MKIITEFPIALASHDTTFPRGAKLDNTHCPNFLRRCSELFAAPSLLDLGCAGGGLVEDFLEAGLVAFGVDGSSLPKVMGREPWAKYPYCFGTADITQPFQVVAQREEFLAQAMEFDIVSAWEVLEHISESDLPFLVENIRRHMKPASIFCASICTVPDEDPGIGAVWHVTVKPREWWIATLQEFGFRMVDMGFNVTDFPRGSGNPLATGDWAGADFGFHVVAKKV